jgi:predicted RNA-binding Zn-ribbon protein involved in translation (DUF1610 family)
MNDIKFTCPQCGQHLTVGTAGAGTTVACPNCGQAILVPQVARMVAKAEPPKQMKWGWIVASLGVVALLAAGVLLWQTRRQSGTQSKSAFAETGAANVPAQPAADGKEKAKWSKALNDALRDLQNDHDPESESLVSGILASLNRPGGLSPAALTADGQRLKERVRQLVQRNELESAASLNWAQWQVLHGTSPEASGPAHPNHITGGKPGPGGLVLYLPFDQPADANGRVHDESGAGNDGEVFGAQWVPDGRFGGAYQFHITNLTDRIVIPNSDTLNPDHVTVSAWIKAAGNSGFWRRILDKDCHNAYCLDLGGDLNGKAHRGKLQFEIGIGYMEQPDRVLDDGQWHHVAGSYDGQTMRCYVDGLEVSRRLRNAGPLKKSSWDLCIGNSVVDYGTGEFLAFNGLIDEVRIYNRALSPAEIESLAAATRAGIDVANASPEQQAANELKLRRVNTLNNALRDAHGFSSTNDVDTANLVSNILASFDQPGGLATNALALDMERMKSRVRELIRRGAWESAAILNRAQVNAFWSDSPSQPPHPNHKSGGTPGPGGLVLYLPFDQPATNGVIHDASGASNDGRVSGAQWVPDGKFGGAYRFSLTNFDDRIVIPNSDTLNPQHITLAAWIKPTANYGFWRRIMDKDCWHGYCFSLSGDARNRGKPWFEGQAATGSNRVLDDNRWHHVAATFDGETARCYIDGVESGSRRVRNPGPLKPDDWDLGIGNSVPDFGGEMLSFDGLIDEVRIYNHALSPAEIKSLATATHAGVGVIGAPANAPGGDAAERLKEVKQLYQQGLINKDEYDQKVKEIMNSL